MERLFGRVLVEEQKRITLDIEHVIYPPLPVYLHQSCGGADAGARGSRLPSVAAGRRTSHRGVLLCLRVSFPSGNAQAGV